ncbi:MAG: hypothetical protein IT177_01225 [Acidobacteria bacterium]|nr:hypothetical protein [Acidobacteriota bacterium]
MRFIIPAALVLAAGCSGSPTSPSALVQSPVAEARSVASPGEGAPAGDTNGTPALRWDVVAPGCTPRPVPSPLPDPTDARLSPGPNGMTAASWSWTSAGRDVLLIAYFIEHDGMLKLCSWDTSDV